VPNVTGIKSSTTEEATSVSVAPDARSSVACRRALPSVRGTQQPSGVNACGIQHNRALFDVPPVVRSALLVSSLRIMGGYVWRPSRLPCVPRCRTHSTASQCARAKEPRQHMRSVTRLAPVWWCTRPRAARAGNLIHRYATTVKSSRRCPAQGSTVLTASRVKACARPEEAGPPLTRLRSVLWRSGQRRSHRMPGNPGEQP